jgi:type VI secretion system ImpC/EvpB family protein
MMSSYPGQDGSGTAAASTAGPVVVSASAPPRELAPDLIAAVLEATRPGTPSAVPAVRGLLDAASFQQALARLVELTGLFEKDELVRLLGRAIAHIDRLLNDQVNAILHHPKFQKLESSWRGLRFLVEQLDDAENVKIRVLNVSWQEIARDADRATEFDQSQLFRKVYSEEFDTPGGEPFGVLLGDYAIHHQPSAEHPVDDVAVLRSVSGVAAAAFAPFFASAHPSIFGLNDYSSLEQPLNLPRTFEQLEYIPWRSFRDREDARFVGLAMPRVLMRLPYEFDVGRKDGFCFREDVSGPDRGKYLWGGAVYALGAVLVRSFGRSGWLADISGVRPGVDSGGLVSGLPVHSFSTDKQGVATKSSAEVIVTDRQEPELSELGFIPLCHCQDTEFSAFYAVRSAQKPKTYDDPAATANAALSAAMKYTLCVSRFAHHLKAYVRDKVGSFTSPAECQSMLHRWFQDYVTPDAEAAPEVKAKFPLREAQVQVREHPGKPGLYLCTAHLWPHFELEGLNAGLKLTTELTPGRRA